MNNSIITEYEGNKYYVHVDPRIQKAGQKNGYRGDCVIRSLSLATGLSYINVARKLHVQLDDQNDVPVDFHGFVWKDVFKFFNKTYRRNDIDLEGAISVNEFARRISRRKAYKDRYFILGVESPKFEYGHAVFVKNGRFYDVFDCGEWIITDIFDVTDERRISAYDYKNIVKSRRNMDSKASS